MKQTPPVPPAGQSLGSNRYRELKQMLEGRRRELQTEVQGKIHGVRGTGDSSKLADVMDSVDSSEADIQEDIELAIIQMKAETLGKIDDALARLEQGTYGNCGTCGDGIAEKRLRALPFAVRCKPCEETREREEQRLRQQHQRRGASTLFFDI